MNYFVAEELDEISLSILSSSGGSSIFLSFSLEVSVFVLS